MRTPLRALLVVVLAFPTSASAATFTVNSLADTSSGGCTAGPGGCTLREAIAAANSTGGADVINFSFTALPGAGPVISLTAALPDLADDDLLVDGFDCTGCGVTAAANTNDPADGFNTVIGPTIDGAGMGVIAPLLSVEADGVVIRGLNLRNGTSHGIEIEDDSDTEEATVTGCFIGTDRTGTIAMPNAGDGVHVEGRDDHEIGPFNLISGNGGDGVFIDGGNADDIEIFGNLIGVDVTAAAALPNGDDGVHAEGPSSSGQNLNGLDIGDGTEAGRNVISGNTGHGIFFERKVLAADIDRNTIGTNGAQTLPLGNGGDGIRLLGTTGSFVYPRLADVIDNVLSGNVGAGIYGEASQDHDVLANFIGTDDLGLATNLGNAVGIHLHADVDHDTEDWDIGGLAVDANVIAYNLGDGILMDVGGGGEQNRNNGVYINYYRGNGGLAVDLAGNGVGTGPLVPGTGPCTADSSLGNRGMPRPVITAAYLDGTTLTVEGAGCAFSLVGVWEADLDPSGYGEPDVYIDDEPADGTGSWSVTVASSAVPVGTDVTAMQLDPFDDETSEASAVATVVDCDVDGDLYTIPLCGGNDCNDANPFINPGGTEVCNGLDDNCDGILLSTEVDLDGDGVFACFDCDDTDATVNPNATEVCNGVDDDCDGTVDDGFDLDGDGVTTCGPDGVPRNRAEDCDDASVGVNPNAPEICNGVDDDCDGSIDEGFDLDSDGVTTCAGDCDDGDAAVNPGATEVCNAVDDDCDGSVDEGFDADGDGVTTCGPDGIPGSGDEDCDDAAAGVNPNAAEVCDGLDQDCDGLVDEDFDVDGDGVTTCGPDGAPGTADDDCDDGAAGVNPGEVELCDGVDQDCDGLVDEDFDLDGDGVTSCGPDGIPGTGDDDCDDGNPDVNPGAVEICNGLDDDCNGLVDDDPVIDPDDDGDGWTLCDGDCDDQDPDVNPDADEECNGIDDDCDGEVDEGFPEVCCDEDDLDGDGFSDCDGDCDDDEATVFPGAEELCDGLDNDCDGVVPPEEDIDADADGWPECLDCDDLDPDVNPDAEEICGDGIDNDCDGVAEEGDADRDGFRSEACAGEDCDDMNPRIHPDATEICGDGIDQDCDGLDAECVDAGEAAWATGGGCGDCASQIAPVSPGAAAALLALLVPGARRRRRA